MVAVGVVLVLIGLLVMALCLWLGDGRAKGIAVLGFRNFIINLLT
jgi:hypothetical protein